MAAGNKEKGDTPYTLQPELCGQEGTVIYLTPNYLLKDPNLDVTHRPGKLVDSIFK